MKTGDLLGSKMIRKKISEEGKDPVTIPIPKLAASTAASLVTFRVNVLNQRRRSTAMTTDNSEEIEETNSKPWLLR